MSDHRDTPSLGGILDAYEAELLAASDGDVLAEATASELAAARGVLEIALAVAASRQQPAASRRRRGPLRASTPSAASVTRHRPEQMRATFSLDPKSGDDDDGPDGLPT